MAILTLSNSNEKIKIDETSIYLQKFDWRLSPDNYARATINGTRYYLHRFLTKAKKGELVDHKDNDTLNNQISNLRICTHRENSINARPRKNKKYSKFKGVSYCSTENRKKKWVAACEVYGKRITIGRYSTEEEARDAYDKKAKELFGEFAYQNNA